MGTHFQSKRERKDQGREEGKKAGYEGRRNENNLFESKRKKTDTLFFGALYLKWEMWI